MSPVASVSSAFARTRVAPRPIRRSTLAPDASCCTPRRSRLAPAARCVGDARDGSARAASSSSRPRISDEFIVPRLTDTFALEPVPSPFAEGGEKFGYGLGQKFVDDDDCVLLNALRYEALECGDDANFAVDSAEGICPIPGAEEWHGKWAMRAGPRERILFQPEKVRAAIVTCGGLCPGLNDVIRQLVITLEEYGVEDIRGIRYGFRGFFETEGELRAPVKLTSRLVETIHLEGGSVLGSSRGGSETSDIVDAVSEMGLDFLFVIGGNGSHAGALAIDDMCKERGVCCSVIGIPKTIDNDILLLDRTFGFQTAVDEAINAIRSAAIEARSAYNGVGLVRLMGRQSGFIAMNASLASGEVDVCLIPEINTPLEGPGGILAHVRRVLNKKEHCVVVVAEGAGQDVLGKMGETDASGNPVLQNFAKFVQAEMKEKLADLTPDIKYIDPTYMVRACPTNSSDAIYCSILGQNAVHAAFAGITGATVGLCNGHYVYLPIQPLISRPREVDPEGRMWERLRLAINQPVYRIIEDSGANEAKSAR